MACYLSMSEMLASAKGSPKVCTSIPLTAEKLTKNIQSTTLKTTKNMLNLLKSLPLLIVGLCMLLLMHTTCKPKEVGPKLSKVPRLVSFKITTREPQLNGELIKYKVVFEDGDGDIGVAFSERIIPRPVNPATANKPFQPYTYTFNAQQQPVDSAYNRFCKSVFITVYQKNQQGIYQPFPLLVPEANFDLSIDTYDVNASSADKPEGYTFGNDIYFSKVVFKHGEVIRLDIQVVDRARNISNMLTEYITLSLP